MHNWGPSACTRRCGMFFVQAAPEPALYILLVPSVILVKRSAEYGEKIGGWGREKR